MIHNDNRARQGVIFLKEKICIDLEILFPHPALTLVRLALVEAESAGEKEIGGTFVRREGK